MNEVPSAQPTMRAAAEWFALMHGPDADVHRAAFDVWLAADHQHRDAYSRIAEIFSLGKRLPMRKPQPSNAPAPQPERSSKRPVAAFTTVAVALVLIRLTAHRAWIKQFNAPIALVSGESDLTTRIGEIRRVRLDDASYVTLDTGTRLVARFSASRRDLWLERGRARFDVAHEWRPFIVHAGSGTVIAHGTLFDVRLDNGHATVRLLRGAIDVDLPGAAGRSHQVRRIEPGQAVAYDNKQGITLPAAAQKPGIVQAAWPAALLDFDDVAVGDVIAEANRYSQRRVVVTDPQLANARVSGTFRVGDPDRLAHRLARLFPADVVRSPNGDVLLRTP